MSNLEGVPVMKIARVELVIGAQVRTIEGGSILAVQSSVAGPHLIGYRFILKDGSFLDVSKSVPTIITYDRPSGLVAP